MKRKTKSYIRIGSMLLTTAGLGVSGYYALQELRQNNIRSGELYLELQKADQSGVGVNEALAALQLHVTTHMNASPLPQLGDNAPVQLAKSYERAKLAEAVRVTSERERINAEAIASCERQFGNASLIVRTQCVANYSTANPVTPEREIVADLYRYDFASPLWTPDRAGWLVLVTIALALMLVIQLASRLLANFFIKE